MDVEGTIEFIDRDPYAITPPKRDTKEMNVNDGAGIILPRLSDKAFQFRIPWGKGLLVPFDFLSFAKQEDAYFITDVWGGSHHIIEDDVQIILSASQLKTWKYYNSMDEYRKFFTQYDCEAGKCNEEVETRDIHMNYQYFQTLSNLTKDDLKEIAQLTNDDIRELGSNKEVMLRAMGATEENKKKDNLQQALLLHNNLLNDPHVKQ